MLKHFALVLFITGGFAMSSTIQQISPAVAATKKISKKRSDFTPEQRAKLMALARNICRKHHGAGSTVNKLDYYHWKVWCRPG